MGTLLHIAASGPDEHIVARAIEAAERAVERVEHLMSFHDERSEVSRLNRDACGEPQRVDAWTLAVLRRAQQIARLSEGLFDVSVAPLLVSEGLLPQRAALPAERADWRSLHLLADGRVFFARPLLIDLGGIAKGFAVDRATHALRRAGCTQATVNAGGDLRRFGARAELIHLRTRAGLAPVAQLRCGAVATSAANAIRLSEPTQAIGHIVDPRSGQLLRGTASVMVAAPTCIVADALTKVAALAGPSCQPLLDRFGAQVYWESEVLPQNCG
jgi:FAD:protein FMN transferase